MTAIARSDLRPPHPRVFGCVMTCAIGQAAVALAMGSSPSWHGGVSTANLFHDVLEYHEYAGRMFGGEVPYRDFTVEYPPLALVLFLIPRCVASSFGLYTIVFGLEMLAFNAVCLRLAARWTATHRGVDHVPGCLAWYTAFFVVCNPVAMARYDLAAMTITFASACWLLADRPVAGGVGAAVAVLLKVVPGVAAAPAFFRELADLRASRGRGIVAASLVVAAGLGAWFGLGRGGVFRTFQYHAERGLEIGSVYAGALSLIARATGSRAGAAFNHFAVHLESPPALRLASLATLAQGGALLLALGSYWRSGMREGLRASTACLLAVVVFGKVLSPQYLIWLIPFIACLAGRSGDRARWAFLVSCLLTTLVYPVFFPEVVRLTLPGIWLLNARNASLVVLFGLLIFDREAAPHPARA